MTLVYHPEPGDVLVPRQYQKEIFLKAQQRNVIAVLDTGSGKTLISALLIKWISMQASTQKKVIVFLVPKVPLVEQQSNFIARHTALRVAQVHSELSAGVMDRARWSNLFSQSDVLVMTGEHIPYVLNHSVLIESRADFPECTHALALEHEQGMHMLRISPSSSVFAKPVLGFASCLRRMPSCTQEPPLHHYNGYIQGLSRGRSTESIWHDCLSNLDFYTTNFASRFRKKFECPDCHCSGELGRIRSLFFKTY